jgi:GMP synthase PP-ATPase subunit
MTGRAAEPGKDILEEAIWEIKDKILALPGVKRFVYDLTSKPPGTTEWE